MLLLNVTSDSGLIHSIKQFGYALYKISKMTTFQFFILNLGRKGSSWKMWTVYFQKVNFILWVAFKIIWKDVTNAIMF